MDSGELQNKIKIQRAMKNVTQEELAIKIGVTRKTINTIENGKFVPSVILAIRLSKFFNIPVEELFTIDDQQQ
jgi:putative transcriptional regulator